MRNASSMAESASPSASRKEWPYPEGPVPEGVNTLSWNDIGAFLKKFPARDRAEPVPGAAGVEIDLRGRQIGHYVIAILFTVVGTAMWIVRHLHIVEYSGWILLAAAVLAVWCAAQMIVNRTVIVIQAGSIYLYRSSGFSSSRRVLRPPDMRRILHVECKSRGPDSRHTVEILLVKGDRLHFSDTDASAGGADWFLEVFRRNLDLPVESEISHELGLAPAGYPAPSTDVSKPGAPAVSSGGGFVPDAKKDSFPEFDILLPGSSEYEKFRRRLRVPPELRTTKEPNGFIIRHKNFSALVLFGVAVLALAVFLPYIPGMEDLSPVMRILLAFGGALLISVPADLLLVEKTRFFFTGDMLLVCRRNGEVTHGVPRHLIEAVLSEDILSGGIITDATDDWHISLRVKGEGRPIPLLSLRNDRAAKCFVDTARSWILDCTGNAEYRELP